MQKCISHDIKNWKKNHPFFIANQLYIDVLSVEGTVQVSPITVMHVCAAQGTAQWVDFIVNYSFPFTMTIF